MNVVLDSNVLIAAFATQGICHSLFELCLKDHALVLSEPLLAEVERPLRDRIRVPAGTLKDVLSLLRKSGKIANPGALPERIKCRDLDDLHVLALACNHHARVIVTGDKDLLELKSVLDVPILTPRQFYQLLREQ